jgi:hypothetical protein
MLSKRPPAYARLAPLTPCAPRTDAHTSHTFFIAPEAGLRGDAAADPDAGTLTAPDLGTTTSTEWSSDPAQWGRHLWFYLHTAARNYPRAPDAAQQRGMKNWLTTLQWTIPCRKCSAHYSQFMEASKDPLDAGCADRDKLFAFLVGIHNQINRENGKRTLSVAEARQIYPVF